MTETNALIKVESPEKIIISLEDGSQEEYSIQKIPQATSSLVLNSKKAILQNINLDELFKNLDRCVPLLNISYDALAGVGYTVDDTANGIKISGISLSKSIETLRDEFSNTLDKSVVVMNKFEQGTGSAIEKFQQSYSFLTNPLYKSAGVELASKKLSEIKKTASDMNIAANELSNEFDRLEKQAQRITQDVINENDRDIAVQEYTKRKIASLTSKQEAFNSIKENLDKEVQNYETEYNKISNQIEKNEKRAFGMALASTIIGGVTALAGPILSAFSTSAAVSGVANNLINNGKEQAAQQASQQAPSNNSSSQSSAANNAENNEDVKKYEETIKNSEEQIAKLDNEIKNIEQKIAETQKEYDEATEDEVKQEKEEQRKALLSKKDDLIRQKKEYEDKLNDAKTQKDATLKVLAGVTAGLDKSAQRLDQQAQKYEDKNDNLYNQLEKISQYKADAEKARREAERELAEIVASIANSTTVVKDLSVVCESLVMAINSMRFVKVYLSDIALFWKNVEQFCEKLTKEVQSLKENVDVFKDVEDYIEIFKTSDFVSIFFINITYWVALNIISVEYQEAFNKTRDNYRKTLLEHTAEIDHRKQWERARELAGEVSKEINANLTK